MSVKRFYSIDLLTSILLVDNASKLKNYTTKYDHKMLYQAYKTTISSKFINYLSRYKNIFAYSTAPQITSAKRSYSIDPQTPILQVDIANNL